MKNFVYANELVLHYRRRCAVPICANWQLNVGPKLSWVRIWIGTGGGRGKWKILFTLGWRQWQRNFAILNAIWLITT